MLPHDYENLYRFQDEALDILKPLEIGFYLTGGTAASRGYLHHRFSEDLDLFVNDDQRFGLWADQVVAALTAHKEWVTRIVLKDPRFVRILLERPALTLKIELVNDVPAHVGLITKHLALGRLDSAENILANKLSALLDREESKDLADVWGFCCLLGLSVTDALEGAQGKAAGLYAADVARALLSAKETDWELVPWLEEPPLSDFLSGLQRVGEQLLLIA